MRSIFLRKFPGDMEETGKNKRVERLQLIEERSIIVW